MRKLLLFLFLGAAAFGQTRSRWPNYATAPTHCNESDHYYNTVTHLDYTCIATDTWSLPSATLRDTVSAKDFLAVGQPDGVTDNTAGLQSCIDTIIPYGGTCSVPGSAKPYVCSVLTSRGAALGIFRLESGATLNCAPPQPTGPITAVSIGGPGSGYTAPTDILTILTGGGTGGTSSGAVTVTSVNGTGGITGITFNTTGQVAPIYSVGQSLATSGGTGTLATINVTNIGFNGFQIVDLNPMILPANTWRLTPGMQQGTLELAGSLFIGDTIKSYNQQPLVLGGLPALVGVGSVQSSSASVTATNILALTNAVAGHRYSLTYDIHQAAAGGGTTPCTTPATVFATLGWTNEIGVAKTFDTGVLNLQGTGSATLGHDAGIVPLFIAYPSTPITYTVTWVNGATCNPQPKYTLSALAFAY